MFFILNVGYVLNKNSILKLLNSNFLSNLIPIDEFLPILYCDNNNSDINNYNINKFVTYAIEPKLIKPKNNAFEHSETESQPFYQYRYENNFYNNKIQCVSVASDPVDGFNRFIESTKVYGFPYKILGMGKPWGGNDMIKGPGGGYKVVYLENIYHNLKIVMTDLYY